MELGIKGKKVLVVGASQGCGKTIALDFAKEGCKVAIVARREDKLREIVNEMGKEGRGHSFYAIDLMEDGAPAKAVSHFAEQYGSFDIVIHNVGGTLDVKDPLSAVEEWYRVWRFNVGIAIEINTRIIPPMQKQKWGRIIHISSISAESVRGATPYAAAKAYINAYVKGLGRSLAQDGIVVSALMPGAFIAPGGDWEKKIKNNPNILDDFLRHHQATGRLGTPEEISPFALFMASQYVTFAQAALIPIDGGTM
jgi:3-oxoacyl-[acyl-carrier protein] reductase